MIRQAVLLAAGAGKRLLPLTADRPKCMVEVGGRPIVDGLLDSLALVGIDELIVVTGYRADALRAHLGASRRGVAISYIDNPHYATTNNIVSVLIAAPYIRPPFMLLESDIEAEPAVISSVATPDRMAVAAYDATMSGTGVRLGPGGAVSSMILGAHRGPTTALYKTVNFYSFSAAVWEPYIRRLASWINAGRVHDYYEAVLADLINTRAVSMSAADVTRLRWHEIDDATDLARTSCSSCSL